MLNHGELTNGGPLTIAIQPDVVRHKNGEVQSFSERWVELSNARGINVREVDVFAEDLYSQLSGCDGFMWRYGFLGASHRLGKRLLPAIEQAMGIPVFPSGSTAWHFEDKIAQYHLLRSAGIPTPRTWVFWDLESALRFCRAARYPLVMKLAHGFQSRNVHLLRTSDEAMYWARRMFGSGLSRIVPPDWTSGTLRRPVSAIRLLLGRSAFPDVGPGAPQHGYFYVQEFLPDNTYDTRVTVIGNRAFGFRRFNRPGDFRASGSGRIDWDATEVDEGFIRMAFQVAYRLRTQSIAIDGLFRGSERTVGEISYTYATWAIKKCPGHWILSGTPEDGRLEWTEGEMRSEDAIFDDFVEQIHALRRLTSTNRGGTG